MLQAILDAAVGVVDILGHLAAQHAEAVENLARLIEAFLHSGPGLVEQPLQLGRIGTVGRLAAQALVDEAEHAVGDLFRAVVRGLAFQGSRFQTQALAKTRGQGLLGIHLLARHGGGEAGEGTAVGGRSKRGQGIHVGASEVDGVPSVAAEGRGT
ncbi:hypothetical protein D9M71_292530 [compost metagenome]